MFFKNGIAQLKNQKAKTGMIVVGIVFATALMFMNNILSDTVQSGTQKRFDMIYGDIDYTIYRSDGSFPENESKTIPNDYIYSIRNFPNVLHVASRIIKSNAIFPVKDESDMHSDYVAGINETDPDERYLGISIVIDCLSIFGNPNSTSLESLLDTSIITNPVVISKKISDNYGWNAGDEIKIFPANATKAYSTSIEREMVSNGTMTAQELETSLLQNKSRWIGFTITGIIIDASEAFLKPLPLKRNSLGDISAEENTIYVPLSKSLQYVFNNKTSNGIFYFILSTGQGFDPEGLKASLSAINTSIPIGAFNLYKHIQEYANYFMSIIRIIFIVLAAFSLLISSTFIKNMMELNVKKQIHVIGIHKILGFKDSSVDQMFLSQILVLSAISIPIGLVVGYFLSGLIDLSFAYVFLSYNYEYTLSVNIPNTITWWNILISGGIGVIFPLIFGMYPVKMVRKWSILELLHPTHKELENYKIVKKTSEHNIGKMVGERKKVLMKLLREEMLAIESRKSRRRVIFVSKDNPVKIEISRLKKEKAKDRNEKMELITKYNARIGTSMARGFRGAVKFKTLSARKAIIAVIVMVICAVMISLSSRNLFPDQYLHLTAGNFYYWAGGLVMGIVFFMIGMWMLLGDFIGYLGSLFARMSGKFLRGLKRFTAQSIHAHSQNNKNMIGFLTMGFALLVLLSCVFNSVFAGSVKNERTSLGGDIVVFQPLIHRSQLPSLMNEVQGIQAATTYTFLSMEDWSFNRVETSSFIVNQINNFGGIHDSVVQNLNIVVLGDIEEYLRVNIGQAYFVPDETILCDDGSAFIRRLNEPKSTIIDKRLANDLGLHVGSSVSVNINGFPSTFKVVGIARNLPAVPFMTIIDSEPSMHGDAVKHRTMVITRDSLANVIRDFTGNVDIMVKNMTMDSLVQNRTIPESVRGYLSGRITRSVINSVLDSAVGVERYAHRFSTFAPTAPTILAKNITDSRIIYKRNTTMAVNDAMNITSRFYAFEPAEELGMTAESPVIECLPYIGGESASSIALELDSILGHDEANAYRVAAEWLDNKSYCIVNKYAAVYMEDTRNIDYIYENKVGDIFNVTFNDGSDEYSMPFKVVATLDNHLSYYHENSTEREGYMLSGKTFNYDCHLNATEMVSASFYDVFDIDANVIFTSYNELEYMQTVITGLPFGLQTDSLMNHLYVKIEGGHTTSEVIASINAELLSRGVQNISVFAFKDTLIDKLTNFGCVAVQKSPGFEDVDVALNLRNWFVSNGYTWRESSVGMLARFNSETQVAIPLFDAFNINFLTTLVMNALALAVSVYMNLWMRHMEFGILKSMSFENQTIRRFTFIESLAICFIGALIGFISGLGIASLIFNQINAVILRPLVMEVPWLTIIGLMAVFFVITIFTAQIESRYTDKLTAKDSMNFK